MSKFHSNSKLHTFAFFKPNVSTMTQSLIKDFIQLNGWYIDYQQELKLSIPQAEKHVSHLPPKIAKRNINYLTSNVITILLLTNQNYIDHNALILSFRDLLGNSEPISAHKGTIRGKFSSDSISKAEKEDRAILNLMHASDSLFNFEEETSNILPRDLKIKTHNIC